MSNISSASFSHGGVPQGHAEPAHPPPKYSKLAPPPTIKALTNDLSPNPGKNELVLPVTDFTYFLPWSAAKLSEAGHKVLPPYAGASEGDIGLKGVGFLCGAIDALSGFNGFLRRSHADAKIAELQQRIAATVRELASLPPQDTQQSPELQKNLTRQCTELLNHMAVMTTAEAGTKLITDTASFCNGLGNFLGQTICAYARLGMLGRLLEHAGDFRELEALFKAATNLQGLAALEQGLGDDAIDAGLRSLLDKHAGNLEHLRNLEFAGGAFGVAFSVVNGARAVLELRRSYRAREQLKATENRFTHALNALQDKAQAGKEVVSRLLSATKRKAKAAWWACLGGVSRLVGAIGSFILNVLSLCSIAAGPASAIVGGVVLLSYFIRDRMQAYHERRASRINKELDNAIQAVVTSGKLASHDAALVQDLNALLDREKLLDLAQQTGGADCRKQVENLIPPGDHQNTIKQKFQPALEIIRGHTKMERAEILLKSGNAGLQLQGMVDTLAAAPCPQFAGVAPPPKELKEPDLGGVDPDKRLRRNDADKAILAATMGFFPNGVTVVPGLARRAQEYLQNTFGTSRTDRVLALARGLKANGKLMTFWTRSPTEACKDLSTELKSDERHLKPQTLARAFHNNASVIAGCRFAEGTVDYNELENVLKRLDTDAKRQSLREMTRLMGRASNKITDVWELVFKLESASFRAGEDIFKAAAMLHGLNTEKAQRAFENFPSTKKDAAQHFTRSDRDTPEQAKKPAEPQNVAAPKHAPIPEKWHKKPPAAGTIKSHIEKVSTKDPQDPQIKSMRNYLTGGRGHAIPDKAWNDAMATTTEEDFLTRLAGAIHLHDSELGQLNARQLAAVLNTENAGDVAELRMPGESQDVTQPRFSDLVRNEAFDNKPSRLVNIVIAIENRDTQRLKKLVRALPTSSAPEHPLKTLALALVLTHPGENFEWANKMANQLTELCAQGDDKSIHQLLGPTTSAMGVVSQPASVSSKPSTSLPVQEPSIQVERPQASQQDLFQQIERGMRHPGRLDPHAGLSQRTDEKQPPVVIDGLAFEMTHSLRNGFGSSSAPREAEHVST